MSVGAKLRDFFFFYSSPSLYITCWSIFFFVTRCSEIQLLRFGVLQRYDFYRYDQSSGQFLLFTADICPQWSPGQFQLYGSLFTRLAQTLSAWGRNTWS